MVVDLVSGSESILSCLNSEMWRAMACQLEYISKKMMQLSPEVGIDNMMLIAASLNENLYPRIEAFHQDLLNASVPEHLLDEAVTQLADNESVGSCRAGRCMDCPHDHKPAGKKSSRRSKPL